jgi:hypothetical protein
VPHLGSNEAWPWESDNHTPTALMCMVYTGLGLIAISEIEARNLSANLV